MTSTLPRHDRVRVYEALRTAHLERFQVLEPATVLFAQRNYDFDAGLLAGLDVQQHRGARDLFLRVLRSGATQLEINEPLMLSGVKHSLAAVVAARLGGLRRRSRTRVVSYAIENADPFTSANPRLRSWWRRLAYRQAVVFLTGQVDRLAFGTPGAEAAYAPVMQRFTGESSLLPALPTACETCPEPSDGPRDGPVRHDVVFLGAFDDRKGLRQLLEAWPGVVTAFPDARLRILGKGALQGLAEGSALTQDEVSVTLDPSRPEIHKALREAKVLVLMSQPSPTWREQVGLPIVEGLSHGCEIVTTTETGIASWLSAHGHGVLDATCTSPQQLAAAVTRALESSRTPRQVLADLPPVDGRLAADRWMFAPD